MSENRSVSENGGSVDTGFAATPGSGPSGDDFAAPIPFRFDETGLRQAPPGYEPDVAYGPSRVEPPSESYGDGYQYGGVGVSMYETPEAWESEPSMSGAPGPWEPEPTHGGSIYEPRYTADTDYSAPTQAFGSVPVYGGYGSAGTDDSLGSSAVDYGGGGVTLLDPPMDDGGVAQGFASTLPARGPWGVTGLRSEEEERRRRIAVLAVVAAVGLVLAGVFILASGSGGSGKSKSTNTVGKAATSKSSTGLSSTNAPGNVPAAAAGGIVVPGDPNAGALSGDSTAAAAGSGSGSGTSPGVAGGDRSGNGVTGGAAPDGSATAGPASSSGPASSRTSSHGTSTGSPTAIQGTQGSTGGGSSGGGSSTPPAPTGGSSGNASSSSSNTSNSSGSSNHSSSSSSGTPPASGG